MKAKKISIGIVVIALLVELFCFNFSYFYGLFFEDFDHNILLDLDDFEMVHWLHDGGEWVSEFDPMLIRNAIDTQITELEVRVQADRPIPYLVFFYTDEQHSEFCAEAMITSTPVSDNVFSVQVDKYVQDIRIDLGDDAELRVSGMDLMLNPLYLNFSVSRYCAMLVVCFGFWALNRLQQSRNYYIDIEGSKKEGTGE